MMRRLTTLALTICFAACSAGPNGFGTPGDTGDAGPEVGDTPADDAPSLAQVGEPCAGPADCVSDALCIGVTTGGFRCMRTCSATYNLCESGDVCLPVMTQDAAICYSGGTAPTSASCRDNLDCASGNLCFGAGSEFYCRPACASVDDCDAAETCLRLSSGAGLCRAAVGAACISTADCAAGLTCSDEINELSGRFLGGYCTLACAGDSDCPSSSVCRAIPGSSLTTCLARCDHRSQCRFNGSYDCLDTTVCAGSTDQPACQEMFGEHSLCAPGPL